MSAYQDAANRSGLSPEMERAPDLGQAATNGLRNLPGWASVVRAARGAIGLGQGEALRRELAAAHEEIERLHAQLAEAHRELTPFEQIRAEERAMRQRRLRIARGRRRAYDGDDNGRQGVY